jgi:hypothetical protein
MVSICIAAGGPVTKRGGWDPIYLFNHARISLLSNKKLESQKIQIVGTVLKSYPNIS